YEYAFTLTNWADVEVAYTVPESHGVPINITLWLDGVQKLAMTMGYTGDTTGLPMTTGPVDLGLVGPGAHEVAIYASLLDDTLDFVGWGGTFRIYTADYTEGVAISVKPFDPEPVINPGSQGKVLVAVLSSETFDAIATVDPESLTFGVTGDEDSLAYCSAFPRDVNGDGFTDLTCLFSTAKLGLEETGDIVLTLKGLLVDGIPFSGTDTVKVLDVPAQPGLERKYQNQFENNNAHKDSGQWTEQEQENSNSNSNNPNETGPNGSGNTGGGKGDGGGGTGGGRGGGK
ncbi:MAG TPA: hypothetical protein VD902_14010, partial [Symbiobacteriaceae bacterium]|nr:hypothetical protein [Symbiobacteriaceae bacterium]